MPNRPYSKLAADFRKRLVIADTLAIVVTQGLVLWFRDFSLDPNTTTGALDIFLLALIPLFWLFFLSTERSWESQILQDSLKLFRRPLIAGLKTAVTVTSFAYIVKEPISRITMLSILTLTTVSVLLVRLILKNSYIAQVIKTKKIRFMVIATPEEFEEIKNSDGLSMNQSLGLELRPMKNKDSEAEWLKAIKEANEQEFAGLVIGDNYFPKPHVFNAISSIQSTKSFEVFLFSPIAVLLPRLYNLDDNKMIKLSRPLLIGRYSYIKRLTDVVLSSIALVVLTPLFLVVALLVKVTSKGPIFYTDKRIGRNNQLFMFPKFRSMYQNADTMRSSVLGSPDESMPDRYKQDPRITPFGRIIRRWSIDELPQLWCVLIGTMSIVGPRPILREEALDVGDKNQSRFIAKPGLTGLWQVSGRKETLWENRMQQDVLYIESWSFINDMLLILRTFGTIVSGKGAM
jgi:exopolysaccharide biosynthesis polyprenyl glycosylphosphotransferase